MDAGGNATQTQVDDDPLVIFNTSVWRDVACLERFVWGTVHARFYERREDWFGALDSMHFAMWWVPPGTRPTPDDAMARLAQMSAHGPSAQAFGWKQAPGAVLWREGRCVPA